MFRPLVAIIRFYH